MQKISNSQEVVCLFILSTKLRLGLRADAISGFSRHPDAFAPLTSPCLMHHFEVAGPQGSEHMARRACEPTIRWCVGESKQETGKRGGLNMVAGFGGEDVDWDQMGHRPALPC